MTRFTLTLAFLLVTASAHAQQTRDAVGNGRSALEAQLTGGARTRVGVVADPGGGLPTTDLGTRHRAFVTLQFRLTQHITRLTPDLVLEFDLDAALGVQSLYTSSGAWVGGWIGSPWLGLSIASRTASQTSRASLGLAPPLAAVRRDSGGEDLPTSGWNGWDEWLAVRPIVPFGLQGMGEWRFTHFDVGADIALIVAPTFPWTGVFVNDPALFAWGAVGAWLTGHLSSEFDLGARLQAVGSFEHHDPSGSTGGGDSTLLRASLTPFVRYWFSRVASPSPTPAFAELRMNFNFASPYGPVFATNDYYWSIALATGTTW